MGVKMTAEFKLVSASSLTSKPCISQWLIKDHIELKSLGMLFGAPASAKSFIAMDIAFCIAVGIDWNGSPTEQGNVVYLAGEGHNGIGKRIKALELKYKTKACNLFLSTSPASLSSEDNVELVYDAIQASCSDPTLIVIDTLHRNFGDADENSSKDVSNFLYLVTKLMNATNAAILIIHHSGHGDKSRGRGSSSIKAALDVEYQISKAKECVTMTCTKAKEFQEPDPVAFKLVTTPIPAWLDDDGKQIESAVLESTTYTASSKSAGSTLTANEKTTLKSLTDSINTKGTLVSKVMSDKRPELIGQKYIHIDAWKPDAYEQINQNNGGSNKPDSNIKAFTRAKDKLLKLGEIETESKHYWLKAR